MANKDIRAEIKASGLKFWEVSYAMGIMSDSNFSRKLRRELPDEEKAAIRAIITRLKVESGQEPRGEV